MVPAPKGRPRVPERRLPIHTGSRRVQAAEVFLHSRPSQISLFRPLAVRLGSPAKLNATHTFSEHLFASPFRTVLPPFRNPFRVHFVGALLAFRLPTFKHAKRSVRRTGTWGPEADSLLLDHPMAPAPDVGRCPTATTRLPSSLPLHHYHCHCPPS